jgi:dTDP-4-amino-4,6-dideoxygalactose transaminase
MMDTVKVPFLDLGASFAELSAEVIATTERVLSGGQLILGDELSAFEEEYSDYCDVNYAVGVGSGLDALFLSLKAIDIRPGDEVLVSANTFVATWLAISHCGATPIPVEPCARTGNIDPKLIEEKISRKTKAIIPVHMYGQPCDLDSITRVARDYGLSVIEDAAQAHGARYKGSKIGGHSDLIAWSFYPGKNLGAYGDGGAITTNNMELAERVRELRNYGSKIKYCNERMGYNSRLDNLQAAYLRIKLRRLDQWNNRRRDVASIYSEELSSVSSIRLPVVMPWADPAWHLYVIRCHHREHLQKYLHMHGIQTLVHYPIPPHRQPAYLNSNVSKTHLPITDQWASTSLSIPIGPHLSINQIMHVAEAICKFKSP